MMNPAPGTRVGSPKGPGTSPRVVARRAGGDLTSTGGTMDDLAPNVQVALKDARAVGFMDGFLAGVAFTGLLVVVIIAAIVDVSLWELVR